MWSSDAKEATIPRHEHLIHRPRPHGPHHHGPPGHVTVIAFEGEVTPAEAGAKLVKAGQELQESARVALGNDTVELPEKIWMAVRLDRPPHGALVLKFDVEWSDGAPPATARPIEEL